MLLYILEAVFACIGAVWLLLHVYSLAKLLYTTLLRAPIDLKKQYGQWAVVTGCTDGIGKAMAIELARRGHSIFLIGRSEDKLKALQAEMPTGAETRSHIIDFATGFGAKEATKIRSALEGLDVGVLVNNVGVSYSFPQWFHELTDDELHTLVAVNIDSVNWMTRAVLPLMLKRSKGCVVNVASAASRAPSPLLAAYGATKNYVESLTASLSIEYADKGITFQSHAPLWVVSDPWLPNVLATRRYLSHSALRTPTRGRPPVWSSRRLPRALPSRSSVRLDSHRRQKPTPPPLSTELDSRAPTRLRRRGGHTSLSCGSRAAYHEARPSPTRRCSLACTSRCASTRSTSSA